MGGREQNLGKNIRETPLQYKGIKKRKEHMTKLDRIYRNLSHEIVFKELEPRDKGNYYIMTCPFCDRRNEFFAYKNNRGGHCNRKNECGKSITWFDYVQQKFNLQNKDVLIKLAELAGHLPGEDW